VIFFPISSQVSWSVWIIIIEISMIIIRLMNRQLLLCNEILLVEGGGACVRKNKRTKRSFYLTIPGFRWIYIKILNGWHATSWLAPTGSRLTRGHPPPSLLSRCRIEGQRSPNIIMVKNKRIDNIIIGAKTPFKNRMAYPEVSIGNFRMHHRKCGKRPITRLTCYPLIFFLFFSFLEK
jgi:hypothetical protein